MGEKVLQEMIKQADNLTPDEKLRLANYLKQMSNKNQQKLENKLAKINTHKQEILNLASKYGANNLRVVLEEKAGEEQVYFVINLAQGRSLLDQSGLMIDLQELLGFKLLVFTEDGIKELTRDRLLRSAVAL